MSLQTALARGRALAESLMVDACTVERRAGETTGPGGVITATWTTLYTGKCRVQVRDPSGSADTVGEAYVIVERAEVQLPITVTDLAEGDRISITAAGLDPDLAGKVFTVRDVVAKTHATKRRVIVTEVTS